MDPQLERSRRNEETFAAANERVKDSAEWLKVDPVPFICECSDLKCTAVVSVRLDAYRRVREQDAFLQVPGHDDPDVEDVINDCGDYVLVKKYD